MVIMINLSHSITKLKCQSVHAVNLQECQRSLASREENSIYPFAQMVLFFAAYLIHELSDLLLEIYFLFARCLFQRRLDELVNLMDAYPTR